MPDPTNGVFENGFRIMRSPQGELRRIVPDRVAEALGAGYQDVTARDLAAQDAARDPTFVEGLKAAGVGALSAAAGVAQTLTPESTAGKIATGVLVPPLALAEAGAGALQAATGVNVGDKAKGLPAQLAGAAGGVAAAVSGDSYARAKADVESAYLSGERALAQQSPTAYAGGQIVGEIGASLAGGAVSGAIGKLAGRAAGRAGAGVLGRAVATGGAAAATEGAVLGGVAAQTQARLAGQSDGATWEQLAIGVGFGTTVGLALGGTAGLVTGALERRAASKAARAAARAEAEGTAAERGVADVVKKAEQAAEQSVGRPGDMSDEGMIARATRFWREEARNATGIEKEAFEEFFAATDEAARKRAIARNPEAFREALADTTQRAIQDTEDALTAVRQRIANVENKADDVARLIPDRMQAGSEGQAFGRKLVQHMRDQADEIAARFSGESKKTQRAVASDVEALTSHARHMEVALQEAGSDGARVYAAINNAKQRLGPTAKRLANKQGMARLPINAQSGRALTEKAAKDAYETMRMHLEDESIYGAAGAAQHGLNQGYVQMLPNEQLFSQKLLTRTGSPDWEGHIPVAVLPENAAAIVQRAGQYNNDPVMTAILARSEGAERVLTAYRDLYGAEPALRKQLDSAIQATRTARKALDEALDVGRTVTRFQRDIMGPEQRVAPVASVLPIGGISGTAGAVAGGIVGGPLGAALGGATGLLGGVLFKAGSLGMMSDQLREVAQRVVGRRLLTRTQSLVRNAATGGARAAGAAATEGARAAGAAAARGAAEELQRTAAGRAVGAAGRAVGAVGTGVRAVGRGVVFGGKVASRAALPAAITAFAAGSSSLNQAVQQRKEQLYRLQQDPGLMLRGVQARLGPAVEANPQAAAAVLETYQRAVQHLASTAPATYGGPTLTSPNRIPVVDRLDAIRWARRWAVVSDPRTVIDAAARGMVTADQVETLKVVYPETYQVLRQAALASIINAAAAGRQFPIGQKQMLNILFDLGGAGDVALSPEFANQVDAYRAQRAQQQQQQGQPKPRPSSGPSRSMSRSVSLPQAAWPSVRSAT